MTTETLITAWDETKSVADWAQDARATASAEIILKRYETGQLAETAIGFRKGLDRILAKAVINYDPRIPFKQTVPKNVRVIEAFGETKTLTEWQHDPRCVITSTAIDSRLAKGMSPEDAIGQKHIIAQTKRASPKRGRLYSAFGDAKTLNEWEKDPRFLVHMQTFRSRLKRGWISEEAMTVPSKMENHPVIPKKGVDRKRMLTAFGETKRLSEWVRDPRCTVRAGTLTVRLMRGGDIELAITAPLGYRSDQHPSALQITLCGETKSGKEWSKDPRCKVTTGRFLKRLGEGWDPAEAFEQEFDVDATRLNNHGVFMTAFGESKNLLAWSKDPRCVVPYGTVQARVREGVALEAALTIPNRRIAIRAENYIDPKSILTAFGETKQIFEWAKDPRCKCSEKTLNYRRDAGWEPELSITTPATVEGRRESEFCMPWTRKLTAFGETKTLIRWSQDPRCRITLNALANRLAKGWDPADALSTRPWGGTARIAA
ncbi:MAG: hypothetical protein K8R88_01200 [Armatimonadetes bacterium]|nr:hypothetical protein [Armatimonadota bacterium]